MKKIYIFLTCVELSSIRHEKKNYDKLRILVASYFQLIFYSIDIENDIMMKITQDICLKDTEIL